MLILKSSKEDECDLCTEGILIGDEITSYIDNAWTHVTCAVSDSLTRFVHTEGVTYFLLLSDGSVKVGYSRKVEGVKQRIRSAHSALGGVVKVLGVIEGGRSVEFKMHYAFRQFEDGRSEVFLPHSHILAVARAGQHHPATTDLQEFLVANSHKWHLAEEKKLTRTS